jgi:hypothetical protein
MRYIVITYLHILFKKELSILTSIIPFTLPNEILTGILKYIQPEEKHISINYDTREYFWAITPDERIQEQISNLKQTQLIYENGKYITEKYNGAIIWYMNEHHISNKIIDKIYKIYAIK